MYAQYSGQPAPADIYDGTWSNVSSTYAGRFFRAEGGSSASFGSVQADGAPNITGAIINKDTGNIDHSFGGEWHSTFDAGALTSTKNVTNKAVQEISYTDAGCLARIDFSASRANNKYALTEFRPINSTFRLWKRVS